MAVAKALGWNNPFTDFVGNNRGLLMGLGAGIAGGRNFGEGISSGLQMAAQGKQADEAALAQKQAEEQRAQQINATAAFLRSKGAEDLAAAVEGGMTTGADAFNSWYAQANAKPETLKPTASIQEYQYAQSQGYQGTFQEYETAMKQAGATNIDFNQNQGVAAGFADRMAAANAVLNDPALTAAQVDLVQQNVGKVPGVGNYLLSPETQMANQAQRDFINAILRRESGAVISPDEFANARQQYFPQPGDTPEVIAQKQRNREIALQGVIRSAGPSYQAPPTMGSGGVVDYQTFFGGN